MAKAPQIEIATISPIRTDRGIRSTKPETRISRKPKGSSSRFATMKMMYSAYSVSVW